MKDEQNVGFGDFLIALMCVAGIGAVIVAVPVFFGLIIWGRFG